MLQYIVLAAKHILAAEQGHNQVEFIEHLFKQIQQYVFIENLGIRYNKNGTVKSYWFKTFSHVTFRNLFNKFYTDSTRKSISKGIIMEHIDKKGLAY